VGQYCEKANMSSLRIRTFVERTSRRPRWWKLSSLSKHQKLHHSILKRRTFGTAKTRRERIRPAAGDIDPEPKDRHRKRGDSHATICGRINASRRCSRTDTLRYANEVRSAENLEVPSSNLKSLHISGKEIECRSSRQTKGRLTQTNP
jgi:hypothetical protein